MGDTYVGRRIELKQDLPIESKHGATKGRVFEVVDDAGGFWFVGDAGERCKAWAREVKVLPEDDKGDPCTSRS